MLETGPEPGVGDPGRAGISWVSSETYEALVLLRARDDDVSLARLWGVPALGGDKVRTRVWLPALGELLAVVIMPLPRPIPGWGGGLLVLPTIIPLLDGMGETGRENDRLERMVRSWFGEGNDTVLISTSLISLA